MPNFQRTITITNKLGLHARAATKLAQVCQQLDASVVVKLANKEADASSIIGLMLLAGSQGKKVTVETKGNQAEQALEQVCQLFSDKFDEDD